MRLNGWQRLYCIVVVMWVGYLAYTAYSDNTIANKRIVELTAAVERMEATPEPDGTLAGAITHHLGGQSPAQLAEHYRQQLNAVQQSKTNTIFSALSLAVVPPILLYFVIGWVAAGFRRKSAGVS
ncbi:hypothetical protein WG68_18290 [Arsukibacterium ikkense]|uniref:Uncharacterized protein n=1 Tax=Arsukibacterium ikkense TaxID=336831 RepID=A0A0M2V0I6_9GAMM|nr:hypothetical protein [Arsukibacterium ikkense]KKO43889.1 hypothetical protein WG68_18290 [Arsukibacterium ikkense]